MRGLNEKNVIYVSELINQYLRDEILKVFMLEDSSVTMGKDVKLKYTPYLSNGTFVVFDHIGKSFTFDIDKLHEHIKKEKMH